MTSCSECRISLPARQDWTANGVVGYARGVRDREHALSQSIAPAPMPEIASVAVDVADLLARGDRKTAVSLLMDLHGEAVFGLCLRVLRDRALAEDVLQQVFLEAYRDIDRFQGRSSFRTWLDRIASHRCYDAIRSRDRREQIMDSDAEIDSADPVAPIAQRLERSELIAALEECLTGLSDEVRMTVLLRFQSEMTYDEMSAVLGARSDALHARVSRALPALKRCLEAKGWQDARPE